MTPLNWPSGLTDATPMPYRVWKVLHCVDGRRSADEVARQARTTLTEVRLQLEEAAHWIGQAVQREQQVGDAVTLVVTQCLASAVGPLASLMVDEALDDLGRQATLSTLLGQLVSQLPHDRAQLFARNLRARGMA